MQILVINSCFLDSDKLIGDYTDKELIEAIDGLNVIKYSLSKFEKEFNNDNIKQSECYIRFIEDEHISNEYILIPWPDSQEFMEKEWFDGEAILFSNSAYFIPKNRLT